MCVDVDASLKFHDPAHPPKLLVGGSVAPLCGTGKGIGDELTVSAPEEPFLRAPRENDAGPTGPAAAFPVLRCGFRGSAGQAEAMCDVGSSEVCSGGSGPPRVGDSPRRGARAGQPGVIVRTIRNSHIQRQIDIARTSSRNDP